MILPSVLNDTFTAPKTCQNYLAYVISGHLVALDFLLTNQGGISVINNSLLCVWINPISQVKHCPKLEELAVWLSQAHVGSGHACLSSAPKCLRMVLKHSTKFSALFSPYFVYVFSLKCSSAATVLSDDMTTHSLAKDAHW